MWQHPILRVALGLYILWGAWHWYAGRPVHPADGVLAEAEPVQELLSNGPHAQMGRWTLTARARYSVTARVLGIESYHFDALSDLVPEDVALGWGPMSDNRVLRGIDITQGNRFYFWRARQPTVAREIIISHSANTHLIPANALVAKQLGRLRPGQIVTLSGTLVDGRRSDGMSISTSLSRTDTGAGACEVLLVADVSL